MGFELVIGQNGGFLEAIHPLSDFYVNVAFGVKMSVSKVIFFNDFLGDVLAVDTHVLVVEHVGDKKEIFEVSSTVAGT